MARAEFEMTPYLEEARQRVTEQFKLEPAGPVIPPPPVSGYSWFIETFGTIFTNTYTDKLDYIVNEQYPSIFSGGD